MTPIETALRAVGRLRQNRLIEITGPDLPPVVPLDGSRSLSRADVGGKGWSINRISALGLPTPRAVALTIPAGRRYPRCADELFAMVVARVLEMESHLGRRFGSTRRPLLLAVRSGAEISMPGMLDTILNLGINRDIAPGLAALTGSRRHAEDTFARFLAEHPEFPTRPWPQLRAAVEAVLDSWHTPRAVAYRRHRGLSDVGGTAVLVQAMVFGNIDDGRSGTGVVFSRDPVTGASGLWGDWLPGRQGDDLVGGRQRPLGLAALRDHLPSVHQELADAVATLAADADSVLEIEFTVESGRLWLLQSRPARLATPDGPPTESSAGPSLATPVGPPIAAGICASPGRATGVAVTEPEEAVRLAASGVDVILVRPTTSPDDLAGIIAARATVTETGAATSHAAVVCRELGRPCVVGCGRDTLRDLADRSLLVDADAASVWLVGPAPTAPATRQAPARADPPPTDGDLELLALLGVKPMATVDVLAEALATDVGPALTRLVAGRVVTLSGDRPGLTAAGRQRLARLREAERAATDPATIAECYERFLPHDAELKRLVTAWQTRGDDGADAVLARLRQLHDELSEWLPVLCAAAPRLAHYRTRLAAAAARIAAGRHEYLANPLVDSYHTIWFELHEDLLGLTGRTRNDVQNSAGLEQ